MSSLRSSLLVLGIALLSSVPALAGRIYYVVGGGLPNQANGPVYSVPDNAPSAPTQEVASMASDVIVGGTTHQSYAALGGYALIVARPAGGASNAYDLHLATKDGNGGLTYRAITNFGGGGAAFVEYKSGVTIAIARDDGFLSFRAVDQSISVQYVYRLNVSIAQMLDPAYVPPSNFGDPRLQVVLRHAYTDASPNPSRAVLAHTWSPDGSSIAYFDTIRDPATTNLGYPIKVKSVAGFYSPDTTNDTVLYGNSSKNLWQWLQWSPVLGSDRIVGYNSTGGLFSIFAGSPGTFQVFAAPITTTSKTKSTTTTVVESNASPLWSPDGSAIATSYEKMTTVTQGKASTTSYSRQAAVMANTGWPALILSNDNLGQGQFHTPIGYVP